MNTVLEKNTNSLSFNDFEHLINVVTVYMLENQLNDLEGGYRKSTSHFQNIVQIYFKKDKSELKLEALNLYVKWKRNSNEIKTKVQKRLVNSNDISGSNKASQNIKEIFFTYEEWFTLIKTISSGKRRKLLSTANKLLSEKIQSYGVNCLFKLKQNYFSTSKKIKLSKKFWNGTLICLKCNNSIKAYIEREPENGESCRMIIHNNTSFCQTLVSSSILKSRLSEKERQEVQLQVCSKGPINFRSEADYFGKKCHIR